MISDWTKSETISEPNEILIKYKGTDGQSKEVTLISTPRSVSTSTTVDINFDDRDGKEQTRTMVSFKKDEKRTTVAAVNAAYIIWRLSNNLGLPYGDVINRTETTYSYVTTTDGPKLVKEQTSEFITEWQLAGSLAIEKYNNYTPTGEQFESTRTVIFYDEWTGQDGRTITRTRTSRWMSLGISQEGSQAKQKELKAIKSFLSATQDVQGANLKAIVDSAKKLIFEGTEVRIETGKIPTPEVPPASELLADQIVNGDDLTDTDGDGIPDWARYDPNDPADIDANGDGISDWVDVASLYDPNNKRDRTDVRNATNNRRTNTDFTLTDQLDFNGISFDPVTGQAIDPVTGWLIDPATGNPIDPATGQPVINPGNSVTAIYEMPFAPDDTVQFVNGIRTLVTGGSEAAAQEFGETEAALDYGHAYGQNIVTSFGEVPSQALSPIYIQMAGIEGAFLLDALSYAWGPDGMVVSSDLMLIGVTGRYSNSIPSSSWLRVPVPVASLKQINTTGTIESNPAKANTISLPNGFSARNPASTLAALPKNGTDIYREWRNGDQLIEPVIRRRTVKLRTSPRIRVTEYAYSLATQTDTVLLTTSPFIRLAGTTPSLTNGTATPTLGATETSPQAAIDAGWTRIVSEPYDDQQVEISGLGFPIIIAGTSYTSMFVTSNGYLTFESAAVVYNNLSALNPNVPKLFFGGRDMSYQAVYKSVDSSIARIRWEGNTSYSATTPNRFIEIAFYKTTDSGTQFIEVRTGDSGSVDNEIFMLATVNTSLVAGTYAGSESYVFSGTNNGNAWTLNTGKHIELQ